MSPQHEAPIMVDGVALTIAAVEEVARGGRKVALSASAREKVARARALVDRRAAEDEAVYGLNTGFGALKKVRIPPGDLADLQINLIRSHSVGVGPPLSVAATRALMLLRANVMATGRSGVRLETLELMLAMLNAGVHPRVPSKGSVGASGDLAPLAHLALAMIGEGEVLTKSGGFEPSARALEREGLRPVRLAPKEGLCLVNGTQGMGALGCLALIDAEEIARLADIAGAASLEGKRGTATAFDERIHRARPHPGQLASARNLRALLADSAIARSHAGCDAVQDAYSFRCMPQVHGAARDVIAFVRATLEREINSGTDNPLVFAEPGEGDALLSGGNFHGQPIAFALDFLAIALTTIASISDRRVEQLIDPSLSGLPAFLVERSGLNSGFMMAQVTAAALVNESRVLSTPASVDSIPTSANQEDHVSMGMTSARKALEVIENTRNCLAIEVLAACQAIDLVGIKAGAGVDAAYAAVRAEIPKLVEDRVLHRDIERVAEMMGSGAIRRAVEGAVGSLA